MDGRFTGGPEHFPYNQTFLREPNTVFWSAAAHEAGYAKMLFPHALTSVVCLPVIGLREGCLPDGWGPIMRRV
ncbi:hypothetical protein WG66_014243 [Moniliophthora roreri]|nr:hypothetical protein WG66_014243 [Moniliophthora roreri]